MSDTFYPSIYVSNFMTELQDDPEGRRAFTTHNSLSARPRYPSEQPASPEGGWHEAPSITTFGHSQNIPATSPWPPWSDVQNNTEPYLSIHPTALNNIFNAMLIGVTTNAWRPQNTFGVDQFGNAPTFETDIPSPRVTDSCHDISHAYDTMPGYVFSRTVTNTAGRAFQPEDNYYPPSPHPPLVSLQYCDWYNCGMLMKDCSPPGIREHFKHHPDYQCAKASGTRVQCGWSGCTTYLLPKSIPKHIANTHFHAARCTCICGKTFSTRDALKRHAEEAGHGWPQ